MARCAAVGCKNQGTHPFPKDVKRREKWRKAVRRKNWVPESWARLCASHFKPEDYRQFNAYTGKDPFHETEQSTYILITYICVSLYNTMCV